MEQHTCQNRDCDLPGTEKQTAYQQRWGGLLGRKRLPDKEHRLWFCPKHARWYDHPEDAQPEVPEPWFEDRIKVTEVDVEFDFDSLGDHAPSELTVEEMARDQGSLRVRFWRANPSQNGYQSFDVAGCDVVEALRWATKHVTAAGDEFEGGTFQLGVYTPHVVAEGDTFAQVLWLFGDNPHMGTWSNGTTEWGTVGRPKPSFDLRTLRRCFARRLTNDRRLGLVEPQSSCAPGEGWVEAPTLRVGVPPGGLAGEHRCWVPELTRIVCTWIQDRDRSQGASRQAVDGGGA